MGKLHKLRRLIKKQPYLFKNMTGAGFNRNGSIYVTNWHRGYRKFIKKVLKDEAV